MKAFNIVVITLIFCHKAIAGGIEPSKVCLKSNEEYTTCGTACPLTCDNYNSPPTICTKQCIIGCVCKAGYVRNSAGNCVLPRDCARPCGCVQPCNCARPCECKPEVHRCTKRNEEYNACGSACPLTCDNYKNPPACTRQCVPGCHCQEGYVRNAAGDCVTPCTCPQIPRCPDHEVYNECGTACPLTCKNLNPPEFCTMQCIVGCECQRGYVRDEISGRCVLPSECPSTCGCNTKCRLPHEEYNTCGSACPETCENHNKPRICTLQCVAGCFCESGYVRNKNGQCILPCDC